jgi:hypothetical protein
VSETSIFFTLPRRRARELDAALGAARGDAARERDRLHHGHVRLEAVGAALLHFAVHVDHRRAVHVDRVARLQVDVLREVAVAEHGGQVHVGLLAVAAETMVTMSAPAGPTPPAVASTSVSFTFTESSG